MTKYCRYLTNDGDDDDGGGRISGRVQAPIPSHPGIKYPVRAPPLTPIMLPLMIMQWHFG